MLWNKQMLTPAAEGGTSAPASSAANSTANASTNGEAVANAPYRAAVITLSDKGAAGQREDKSGPLAAQMLADAGIETVEQTILPDDENTLADKLRALCDGGGVDLILTTGGTGLSPRDHTPEATLRVAEKNMPGIAEAMRAASLAVTKRAMLSRGVSVVRGQTLIINLPGSPKAVGETLGFILPALPHGLEMLTGRGGECGNAPVSGK